jgi:hypothetical protein
MNGADGEARIVGTWLKKRPYLRLELAVAMVGHGI